MTWTSGWWSGARKVQLHPGRMGGIIMPFGAVVHSTDIHPDDWSGLLHGYATQPARGNAAHFGLGRTPEQGEIQWAPITRNANHAGGSSHGVYMVNGVAYHPNLVTVSIEVHNAGGLRLVDGAWRWGESPGSGKPWVPHGAAFPVEDVEPDPIRPGRGWHKPTAYQLERLKTLLDELEQVLNPLPVGAKTEARGKEQVPKWGIPRTARRVGHVSLDPDNRSDPWPLIMAFVNQE